MSWLAVLLIGLALADLTHSVRPVRILPECVGAIGAVVVAARWVAPWAETAD